MFQAIVFDLGDTLLDFEPMDTRALYKVASRRTYDHLALGHSALPEFGKYAGTVYRAYRWAYLRTKLTGQEFNQIDLLREVHLKLALPADDKTLAELAWLWYEPVLEHTRVEGDLIATLATMRDAGLRLGVVSNTFVPGFIHDRHLELAGLLPYLPVRVYSSEVGHRKPGRKIFEAAIAQLGVSADKTLFVGDLVKTDIVGARRAGMKTALKQPFANLRPHKLADYLIRRISDLVELLPVLRTGHTAGV